MVNLKVRIDNELVDLDLLENVNISIKYTAKELKDFARSKVPHSLPIQLPKTETNALFFKAFSSVSAVSNLTYQKIEALLFVDNILIISGFLQQNKLKGLNYTATLYSDQTDVFDLIKDTKLGSLDFTDFDHVADVATVQADYNNTSNGIGNLHRYFMNDVGQGFGLYNELKTTVNDIHNNIAYNVSKMTPAQDVYTIFNKIKDYIKENSSITNVEFPLLTSEGEDRLFLHNARSPLDINSDAPLSLECSGYRTQNIGEPQINLNFNYINGNASLHTSQTTTGLTPISYNAIKNFNTIDYNIKGKIRYVGGASYTTVGGVDMIANGATVWSSGAMPADRENAFEVEFDVSVTPAANGFTYFRANNMVGTFYVEFYLSTGAIASPQPLIEFSNIWKDTSFADFFKIFIEAYNLTVFTEDNVLKFMSYNEFYNQSHNLVDFSNRIIDASFAIEATSKELPKSLEFAFDKGEDLTSRDYFNIDGQKIGTGLFFSNIPFLSKKFKVQPAFSSLLIDQLQDNSRGATALDYPKGLKFISSRQDFSETGTGKLYLFYRNSTVTNLSLGINLTDWALGASPQYRFPNFSNYKKSATGLIFPEADINTTDNNLHFFYTPSLTGVNTFAATFNAGDSNTLYNRFYASMIAEMYDMDSKFVECVVSMGIIEHQSIRMYDRIKIDSAVFKIVNLTYSVTKREAKFKLLKTNS